VSDESYRSSVQNTDRWRDGFLDIMDARHQTPRPPLTGRPLAMVEVPASKQCLPGGRSAPDTPMGDLTARLLALFRNYDATDVELNQDSVERLYGKHVRLLSSR
jgi:hypothetical protein